MALPLPWIFHDDGSLDDAAEELLLKHFPGARVVRREESDLVFSANRTRWPALAAMRRNHVMLLKLADLAAFSDKDHILYVDSDILFLRKPEFLMQRLSAPDGGNFFNRDIQSAYIADAERIKAYTGVEPPPSLNAGLSVLNREDISIEKIERVLTQLDPARQGDWNHYDHLIEQTTVAVLAASSRRGAHHLPSEYDVSFSKPIEESVSRHYVGLIRDRFELEGLRFLIGRRDFFRRWAAFAGAD
jgi:hypothetical protein